MTRWIQKAIKRPGSLRKWMQKHYGKKAFTRNGKIKVAYIKKAIRYLKSGKAQNPHKTRLLRKLYFALTLKRLSKK